MLSWGAVGWQGCPASAQRTTFEGVFHVKQFIKPRTRVKRLQVDRAIRIVVRLMLKNSGYFTISPEVERELYLELGDLLGVEVTVPLPSANENDEGLPF